MGSIEDIMQLCRLCLVKDQVNIPIFDETSDIRQTFMKINQCLPVKVSRDDNLPKKICDGCSYKLDMLYVFRNTTVDSEKQLITWLSQLGSCSLSQNVVKDGVTKPEIMVKQETFETTDTRLEGDNSELNVDAQQELGVDAHSYIIQQQKLPYQQDYAAFGEPSGSTGIESEEPAPKRAKRAVTVKKHVPAETEEDVLDTAMQITKAEQEEDSDDVDQPDYVEAPSTSADDQPGPSGVGKGTIEAPSTKANRTNNFVAVKIAGKTYKAAVNPKGFIEERLKCPYCTKTYHLFSQSMYQAHLKKHSEQPQKKHTCAVCHRNYCNADSLRAHRRVHRDDVQHSFLCTVCDKVFATIQGLNAHIRTVHEGRRFLCDVCGDVFKSATNLHSHQKTQHDAEFRAAKLKFPCKFCSKTFESSGGLRTHVRISHEGKRHLCAVCGKVVSSRKGLMEHMTVHTGERPFQCELCERRFTRLNLLKLHLRVHTKEKPNVCKLCGKKYSQRSTLTFHLRTAHGKERPFGCPICPKSFIARCLLRTHLKSHSEKSV